MRVNGIALSVAAVQYLETALWSSTQDDGRPFDDEYGIDDFAPETLESASATVFEFWDSNRADIDAVNMDDSQLGHDLWLTRNCHGAGFWDRGYMEDIGQRLTANAHACGSCDVYLSDDGKLRIS